MKKDKIIYWSITGVFSLFMLFSAYNYLTAPEMRLAFEHLGFPDYFRIELAVAKILGVLILLIPFVSRDFKLIAYAGFTLNLVSAAIAHSASADPTQAVVMPLVFLAVLATSYLYYQRTYKVA